MEYYSGPILHLVFKFCTCILTCVVLQRMQARSSHPQGLTSAKYSYAVCMPSLAHACHQMISKAGVPETSSNSMARPCGGRQPNAPQKCCTQIAMWAKAARNRLHTPCWVSDSAHPASRRAHAQPSVARGSNELYCPAFPDGFTLSRRPQWRRPVARWPGRRAPPRRAPGGPGTRPRAGSRPAPA